mmetsp:Transcript_35024/g.68771  ORF Transcript_35024/g.68771 Transcript_35024/m.68771 type:complete len:209 (-) Transcript_35024:75-701(-)
MLVLHLHLQQPLRTKWWPLIVARLIYMRCFRILTANRTRNLLLRHHRVLRIAEVAVGTSVGTTATTTAEVASRLKIWASTFRSSESVPTTQRRKENRLAVFNRWEVLSQESRSRESLVNPLETARLRNTRVRGCPCQVKMVCEFQFHRVSPVPADLTSPPLLRQHPEAASTEPRFFQWEELCEIKRQNDGKQTSSDSADREHSRGKWD